MANYTLEIRQMMEHPMINGVFTFPYSFYSESLEDKRQFETLFIQHYYFREIGFETPERFKLKLQAKLNLIMPYYQQLALTEWDKLKTVEQMMTSKNLKETTTHEQTINGTNTATSSNQIEASVNQSSTSESNQTNNQNGSESNLADGVSNVNLEDGYLTGKNEINGTLNQTSSSTGTQTNNESGTQTVSGENQQTSVETITFHSTGDIGIQTPAYAITEWRKVLININQMIIDDCADLFMKIY